MYCGNRTCPAGDPSYIGELDKIHDPLKFICPDPHKALVNERDDLESIESQLDASIERIWSIALGSLSFRLIVVPIRDLV